jgi:hypothetical protein
MHGPERLRLLSYLGASFRSISWRSSFRLSRYRLSAWLDRCKASCHCVQAAESCEGEPGRLPVTRAHASRSARQAVCHSSYSALRRVLMASPVGCEPIVGRQEDTATRASVFVQVGAARLQMTHLPAHMYPGGFSASASTTVDPVASRGCNVAENAIACFRQKVELC